MEYKRLTSGKDAYCKDNCFGKNVCTNKDECDIKKFYNRLYELEDKLENGILVELPCNIKDKVYYIEHEVIKKQNHYWINTGEVISIFIMHEHYKNKLMIQVNFNEVTPKALYSNTIGKQLFFKKEEAEVALKKLQENS